MCTCGGINLGKLPQLLSTLFSVTKFLTGASDSVGQLLKEFLRSTWLYLSIQDYKYMYVPCLSFLPWCWELNLGPHAV